MCQIGCRSGLKAEKSENSAKKPKKTEKKPDERTLDLHICQICGEMFDLSERGNYIDDEDLGKDPGEGTVGKAFAQDAEKRGNDWMGFKRADIGALCDHCSYIVARKREKEA